MTKHPAPSSEDVQKTLLQVIGSQTFAKSDRSKEFLGYIVSEALAGRGAAIRGKTIAADVFGRDPGEPDSDNVVRVEARRLRRKLDDYYRDATVDHVVRIHIDQGGYAPRFETIVSKEVSAPPESETKTNWRFVGLAGIVGAVLASGAIFVVTSFMGSDASLSQPQLPELERLALREKSMATLQAANLDLQGRNLLFPILDPNRQKLAIATFEEAIQLDPTYFGSYASAAHSFGTLALLSPTDGEGQILLKTAQLMADEAVSLAPQEAWSHAGRAWVRFAQRNFPEAVRLADLALEMAPNDGSVLDTYGFIMLTTGHFEEAAEASAPGRDLDTNGLRLARRNVFAVSSFHLGNYADTLASFAHAIEEGAPVSAPTLVFIAAAHVELGNRTEAARTVREIQETYPDFNPKHVLSRFYQDAKHADMVANSLRSAGWTTN
ncbi:hypothetical protein [Phaeobacter sp. NW0010-22]|uniref:tetratricopeptide repeat protein n=1 Tax=Phaeobacter sp. NW0010-22 TaxID=3135907 RepID=UPI0033403271